MLIPTVCAEYIPSDQLFHDHSHCLYPERQDTGVLFRTYGHHLDYFDASHCDYALMQPVLTSIRSFEF